MAHIWVVKVKWQNNGKINMKQNIKICLSLLIITVAYAEVDRKWTMKRELMCLKCHFSRYRSSNDMWRVTCEEWHVKSDMWRMTCEETGRPRVASLASPRHPSHQCDEDEPSAPRQRSPSPWTSRTQTLEICTHALTHQQQRCHLSLQAQTFTAKK